MPNLSDLFSAGGFLKWDGSGNTDADFSSNTAAELAADAAFTGAFVGLADVIDEDDMASDSPTKVPTQQSVKAYVDANALSDTGWIEVGSGGAAPNFTNSWANGGGDYANVRFRKVGGIVFVDGYATTGANGTSVFTLPVGFRPSSSMIVAISSGTPAASYMRVGSDGTVKPAVGGGTGSLLSCSFVAA